MDVDKALLSEIFTTNTLIEVPFFQRSYVWKEDLWQRLLSDLEYVVKTEETHFLGSIILKKGEKPTSDEEYTKKLFLVDGQQRLTTFLILLRVLCLKNNDTTAFDFAFTNGKEVALRLGRNDIEAFEWVMNMKTCTQIEDFPGQSTIVDSFNYFVEHVDTDKYKFLPILRNIVFVKITLGSDEDEQQIFDTINSLGVNLTTSELLKNYFFSKDTVVEYEKCWASVFENDEESKEYWEYEIETGRVKRALIDIFFDSYFQIFIQDKKYNISTEDRLMYDRIDKLSLSYQHFINHYCDGDKSVILLPLKEFAECFKRTFIPKLCKENISAKNYLERLNIIIFGLKTRTLIPYILYIVMNVKDENEINKMINSLESYIMRRMVVKATTKNYNNFFTSLIMSSIKDNKSLVLRLKSDKDVSTYYPSNEDLYDGFKSSKLSNPQTKGILYLIESAMRSIHNATEMKSFESYSLEHLMPKKWRNNWKGPQNGESEVQIDSALLTLGNLAIIPQSLNTAIKDAEWGIKKAGKGEKKGLDVYAAGLVTMNNVLLKQEWTVDDIYERATELYNYAKDIWDIE